MLIIGLQIGDHGESVRQWQKFLRDHGYPLDFESMALDGIFGPGTKGGTAAFQTKYKLKSTGIVDSDTFAKALEEGLIEAEF